MHVKHLSFGTHTFTFLEKIPTRGSEADGGAKAMEVTSPPVKRQRAVLDVRKSHTRAVESSDPLANSEHDESCAKHKTEPLCPLNVYLRMESSDMTTCGCCSVAASSR